MEIPLWTVDLFFVYFSAVFVQYEELVANLQKQQRLNAIAADTSSRTASLPGQKKRRSDGDDDDSNSNEAFQQVYVVVIPCTMHFFSKFERWTPALDKEILLILTFVRFQQWNRSKHPKPMYRPMPTNPVPQK